MVFDPNIFFQAAQMQNQNAREMQANVGALAQALFKRKSTVDIEKAAEGAYIKKAAGLPTTPEEDALAMGWDRIQSSKMGYDPSSGQLYPRQNSIFDQVARTPDFVPQAAPSGYRTPDFVPQPSPIANMSDDAALNSLGSPFPTGFQNGSINAPPPPPGSMPEVSLTPEALSQLMGGQGPYEAAEYTQEGPRASREIAEKAAQELINMGAASPDRQIRNEATKAALELKTKGVLQEQQAAITNEINAENLARSNKNILPIVDRLIEINKQTPDIPFAQAVNPALKLYGSSPLPVSGDVAKASRAVDLMRQDIIDLAAPLAKQLGVNPTDKDFQASLDRIVNLNTDKKGRELQLKNLRQKAMRAAGIKNDQENQTQETRQIQTPAGTVTIRRID